ncbi:hypothetical protein BDR04DRAFT_1131549 [Suillus decipiens]|nr:hypothetical protein BDR04DRAFT_1131549 [Suillus decipiens]
MRIPTSITVLCTLIAYAAGQCMECAPIVTYNSVNYILKEQCTVHSGYHCFYRGDDPAGDFCDCYYNVGSMVSSDPAMTC